MGPTRTVAFVCPHGAAKSVIAAAYLDRLAAGGLSLLLEEGLQFSTDPGLRLRDCARIISATPATGPAAAMRQFATTPKRTQRS